MKPWMTLCWVEQQGAVSVQPGGGDRSREREGTAQGWHFHRALCIMGAGPGKVPSEWRLAAAAPLMLSLLAHLPACLHATAGPL